MTTNLTPAIAAKIASDVYKLNDVDELDILRKDTSEMRDKKFGIFDNFTLANIDANRFTGSSGNNFWRVQSSFGYIANGCASRPNELLIAIRGTDTLADIVTDLCQSMRLAPSNYPVHSGFKTTFDSFQPMLHQFLSRKSNVVAAHVVGHSLGGALATIVADYLSGMKIDTKLYTFGCPRVGEFGFSHSLTRRLGSENIFRVHHTSDPISMVPLFPFFHLPFDDGGFLLPFGAFVSGDAHRMQTYIASVGKNEWDGLRKLAPASYVNVPAWLAHAASDGSDIKMYSAQVLWMITTCLHWILKQVANLVAGSFVLGVSTVLDTLARTLHLGLLASVDISGYVKNLMIAILKFLGRTAPMSMNFTASFIRGVLDLLFRFLATAATGARAGWH
jgi:triacylglycerol lipase